MAQKVIKLVPKATENPAFAPPKSLNKAARAEWARLCALLRAKGSLTEENAPLLTAYVAAMAMIADCDKELARAKSMIVYGGNGVPRAHPLIGARNRASQNALQLAKRLGILGSTVTNPTKDPAADGDDYARLGI